MVDQIYMTESRSPRRQRVGSASLNTVLEPSPMRTVYSTVFGWTSVRDSIQPQRVQRGPAWTSAPEATGGTALASMPRQAGIQLTSRATAVVPNSTATAAAGHSANRCGDSDGRSIGHCVRDRMRVWPEEQGETLGTAATRFVDRTCKYVAAHPLQSLGLALAAGYLLDDCV
jgi:ElaB/YqjD/DUF883 family membrane-anchored ribosome-binding protein